jgi:glycosyltransferase involved in cell wall biosynthesis
MILPLVSIVCPLYKPEEFFLRDLLISIAKQTYSGVEVVFSDDTEDDTAKKIIEKYADGINYIYVKNISGIKGIFGNLNNAIAHSCGELVQIFCQDDVMYPDFIVQQVDALSKYPEAGLVFSQFDVINEQGLIYPLASKYNVRKHWPSFIHQQQAINYLLVYGCMPGNLSPVMVRKNLYVKVRPFDQSFPYMGDFEYWIRASNYCGFAYQVKPNLAVRDHKKQASKTLSLEVYILDKNRIYKALYEKNTLKKSNFFLKCFINQEAGVLQLYLTIRALFTKGVLKKQSLHLLNRSPFNLIISFIFLFLTINGRLKLLSVSNKEI